jgi:hypothetical protein
LTEMGVGSRFFGKRLGQNGDFFPKETWATTCRGGVGPDVTPRIDTLDWPEYGSPTQTNADGAGAGARAPAPPATKILPRVT